MMPRPSLKKERTEQILDAFERCVAVYGLEGASLERIAEEAEVQRPIIRHYIGNRDAVISRLCKRVMKRFYAQTDELYEMLPAQRRIDALINALFENTAASDADDVLVFEALVAASPRYPKIRRELRGWVDYFVDKMADEIKASYPRARRKACWSVACGITALYFNIDSLSPLGLDAPYRKGSVDASRRLLDSLELEGRRDRGGRS